MRNSEGRRPSRREKLDELLAEAKALGVLRSPAELAEEVAAPPELAVALITGRPELIKLAVPRALTAQECRATYHLIGTLIQTNTILREHALTLGKLVGYWADHFSGLQSLGQDIERFAEFKTINPSEEEPS